MLFPPTCFFIFELYFSQSSNQSIIFEKIEYYRKEWGPHPSHVLQLHASIGGENLALSRNLSSPLSLRELLAETVPVSGEGEGIYRGPSMIRKKLGHAIAGLESKKFDRSTGPQARPTKFFFFSKSWKNNIEEREDTKIPTNVISFFSVCLFACCWLGNRFSDPFSCILTRVQGAKAANSCRIKRGKLISRLIKLALVSSNKMQSVKTTIGAEKLLNDNDQMMLPLTRSIEYPSSIYIYKSFFISIYKSAKSYIRNRKSFTLLGNGETSNGKFVLSFFPLGR